MQLLNNCLQSSEEFNMGGDRLFVITIDAGTTNTRATMWQNDVAVVKASRGVGVRNTAIDGNNMKLKAAVKEVIKEVLSERGIVLEDINYILASGMITSNVGLVEIPHLFAPVGIDELAKGMQMHYLPDVVDKCIWFIPGVKNNVREVTLENCEGMDIMRGEEVETIGLIERLGQKGPALIILPGSHSKFVSIDKGGKITGCLTSLAGELLSVITTNTLIASSVENSLVKQFNKHMVVEGFKNGKNVGINRTIFTVRIIDQFTDYSANDKANFLLGVVLSADIIAINNSSALSVNADSKVIIAGKDVLRDAFEAIFEEDGYFTHIESVSAGDAENISGFGALCIAKKRELI
ncbi:MAG: 2-dehydro-3-deoxygalactonokinase [Clostridia bacterium]|nr:2-dehydro-3-deoxygalactonokinase [Clostridia bacterium]